MAKQKKNCVLGLDIGNYSVKAVELTRNNEDIMVTGIAYEPILDPLQLEDSIHAALEAGDFKPKSTVVNISSRSVMVRAMTVFGNNDEEINTAITGEIEKFVPYDIEDAQIDYYITNSSSNGQSKVLVSVCKRQDIDDLLDILHRVGVYPNRIDLEYFALLNAFEFVNDDFSLVPVGKAFALVNIGASKSVLSISDGTDYSFREIFLAGNQFSEAISTDMEVELAKAEQLKCHPDDSFESVKECMYPVIENLAKEISNSLDLYKSQVGRVVDTLVFSGGSVALAGLPSLISKLTGVNYKIFSSFGSLKFDGVDEDYLSTHAQEFMVALGMAYHVID